MIITSVNYVIIVRNNAIYKIMSNAKPTISKALKKNIRRNFVERLIEWALMFSGLIAILVTFGIVYILVSESIPFFDSVSLKEFLTSTIWTPNFEIKNYGILPLVAGTVTITGIALIVAIPLGTITAVYLSEFASHKVKETVKPVLELLVGVPTVVFGYFALLLVTPLLQKIIPDLASFNMLGPGIVMGIMIVPYIASVAEDSMRAVPMAMREGSYAMGATRFQTAVSVVMPAALSGIIAAYILAISRGIGETMIVAIAAGQQPNFTFNPIESAATITAYIVSVALGDLEHGGIGYQSIFAAGMVLFIMTLSLNILGQWTRNKFSERY